MSFFARAVAALMLCISPLFAQTQTAQIPAGTLHGRIVNPSTKPVAGATVILIEKDARAITDADGRFEFTGLSPAVYNLQITSRRYGSRFQMVTMVEGKGLDLIIRLDLSIHEELVVSVQGSHRSTSDIAQAVNVMNEEALKVKLLPTLGEMVANEPGISSSSFGAGASRPVIRGMGGDRIRVLESGMGTGDASTVSPDHAISLSTSSAERVEILRGPATLRYGANAVGGVVNVLDGRIPEYGTNKKLEGTIELRGDTVASQKSALANLGGGTSSVVWHLDYSQVESDDYRVPGVPDPSRPEQRDTQENSSLDNQNGAFGFSYIMPHGFVGASYSRFDSLYGIPGVEEGPEGKTGSPLVSNQLAKADEGAVSIDMEQSRFDLRGEHRFQDSLISSITFRYADTDYQHQELEGAEIGTQFFNDSREVRLEANQRSQGIFDNGSIGFQSQRRDFFALGEEAIVPPTLTTQTGAYFFEEIARNEWRFSFGSRYDHQRIDADYLLGTDVREPVTRVFNGFSSSFGLILGSTKPYNISFQLSHTKRPPNAEELFSLGPHIATNSFEVGNPTLGMESSTSYEVSLRRVLGALTGELNLYRNEFSDYIYERATGNQLENVAEYVYSAGEATFRGGELHLDWELFHSDPHHLNLELSHDVVRAGLDNGDPLPRITPQRTSMSLRYESAAFWSKLHLLQVANQNHLAPLETPTEGYQLLDLNVGIHYTLSHQVHHIVLNATNLGDAQARAHNSFLKNQVLLPGRNFSLAYRVTF